MDPSHTDPASGHDGAEQKDGDSIDTLPVVPRRPGVLIADTEARIRVLLRLMLREHGFVVFVADHGSEALRLYRNHQGDIELVLLDLSLPDLDGPAALRALQEINPAVRCCFLGSSTGPCQKADLLGLGAVRVFTKSFGPQDLVQTLWSLVHESDHANGAPEPARDGVESDEPGPAERRASPRYPCQREHLYGPAAGSSGNPSKGRLADLSAMGARFVVDRPLEIGDRVALALPGPDGPIRVVARVVRVEAAGEQWSVACIFTSRLSDEQVLSIVD